ncbi:MAG: heavy metal-associated domain-containing protein [Patescibacteria group bacterium]
MNSIFHLKGLSCQSCAKLATMKIEKVPGVKGVRVDLESGRTEIDSDREIEAKEIESALNGTDYQVVL